MNPEAMPEQFRVSQAIYQRLLLAYPRRHRTAYGREMAQLFRDQCRDAWNEARNWGLLLLWLRTLPDVASTSIIERIAAFRETKTMSEKITGISAIGTAPKIVFGTTFVVVFLLTVVMATLITFILPESYASTARIKVEPDVQTNSGTANYDPYFIQTTFEIIQSPVVLNPVIDRLHLNEAWGKKYFNGEALKSSESSQILKQRLQLAPIRNTQLIAITVYSDDAVEAADLANAVAQCYGDYRNDSRGELAAKKLAYMQQQYAQQELEIQQLQTEVAANSPAKINTNTTAGMISPKERDLGYLLDAHKSLFGKIEDQKLEIKTPKILVQIVDRAEPGKMPVRPNKVQDIVIGIFAGGTLGLLAGGLFAWITYAMGGKKTRVA